MVEMDRVEFVMNLTVPEGDDHARSLCMAFIGCLSAVEAANLLDHVLFQRGPKRRYALERVAEDMQAKFLPKHAEVLDNLAAALIARDKGINAESLGFATSSLLSSAPEEHRRELVGQLLNQGRKSLRNRAYAALGRTWDVALMDDVWRGVADRRDAYGASIFAQHAPEDLVWERFDVLREVGGPAVSRAMISRLASAGREFDLDEVEEDPITRTYLAAKLKRSIDLRRIEQRLSDLLEDERAGLLVWSLGKLGEWDLLQKIATLWPQAYEKGLQSRFGIAILEDVV